MDIYEQNSCQFRFSDVCLDFEVFQARECEEMLAISYISFFTGVYLVFEAFQTTMLVGREVQNCELKKFSVFRICLVLKWAY